MATVTATLGSTRTPPGVSTYVAFSCRIEGGQYFDFDAGWFSATPARPLGLARRAAPWDPSYDFTLDLPADLRPCVLLVVSYLLRPGQEAMMRDPAKIPAGQIGESYRVDWPLYGSLVAAGLAEDPPPAEEPPPPPPATPARCQGRTAAGAQCSRSAGPSGYCYQHVGQAPAAA